MTQPAPNFYRDFNLFKYLNADMIERPTPLTIKSIVEGEVRNASGHADKKPIVYFKETTLGLPLNITNGRALVKGLGKNWRLWSGQTIVAYTEKNRLMLRMPNKSELDKAAKNAEPEPTLDEQNDALYGKTK